jgi:hypothetical protein
VDARLNCRRNAGEGNVSYRWKKKRYFAVFHDFHCKHVMFLTPGNAFDSEELQVIDADWPAGVWSRFAVAHLQPPAFFPMFYNR